MKKFNPKNSVFQNWNKDLYIAIKDNITIDDYNNEIITYKKPFYYGKVNYQPLTTKQMEAYIKAYGETENNIVSCLINSKDRNKFGIYDLAYLYGANPKNEKVYGLNANYKVRAFKEQNTKIMVIFEEIIKDNNVEEES